MESQRAGVCLPRVRERLPGVVDVVLIGHDAASESAPAPARLGRSPGELFREYLGDRGVEDDRLVALFDQLLEEAHEA